MLTLVRGKARKSVIMNTMYRGTSNSVFVSIKIGDDDISLTNIGDIYEIPHVSVLKNLLTQLADKCIIDKVRSLFVYGSFDKEVIEIFKEVHMFADGRLDFVVSIQDRTILNHHLVLEEIY